MVLSAPVPDHWLYPSHLLGSHDVIQGRAVIFDLDGVLSNATDRQHFIDKTSKRDWDNFFASCGEDPLIEDVAELLSLLDVDLHVILLTGRPISVQKETVAWLNSYSLRWDLLVMRNFGNHTHAKEFKAAAVDQMREGGIEPILAFEDDKRNVEMFKSLGIPCIYIHSGYYD